MKNKKLSKNKQLQKKINYKQTGTLFVKKKIWWKITRIKIAEMAIGVAATMSKKQKNPRTLSSMIRKVIKRRKNEYTRTAHMLLYSMFNFKLLKFVYLYYYYTFACIYILVPSKKIAQNQGLPRAGKITENY